MEENGPFEFGPFRLDGDERSLTRDGAVVPLPPKVFETLLVLVARAGRLVRREELMKLVWPDSFVADATLSQNVWLVRRALEAPGFEDVLETVPRVGYRFRGPVRVVEHAAPVHRPRSRCWLSWGRRRFPLEEGSSVIGRVPESEVWIDHPTVSRSHARIVLSGNAATLHDLGSKNATFLNGHRVEAAVNLADHDSVRVGSVQLVFHLTPLVATTRTARD